MKVEHADIKILRVAVVLHGHLPPPGPDMSGQQSLVGSLFLPASSTQWILENVLPGPGPVLPHLLLAVHLHTARGVAGVVVLSLPTRLLPEDSLQHSLIFSIENFENQTNSHFH